MSDDCGSLGSHYSHAAIHRENAHSHFARNALIGVFPLIFEEQLKISSFTFWDLEPVSCDAQDGLADLQSHII